MKQQIRDFIRSKVEEMRLSVIASIDGFKLSKLLVNPYLPSAFYHDHDEFIRNALQSSIHKSIQTKFGNFLEEISIKVCGDNAKSGTDGVDLDLVRKKNHRLLVSVKSSTTWGNTQSTKKQGDQFKKAKKTINQNDRSHEITSVMGICCAKNPTTDGLNHADIQICGQNYWYLISGEKDFYQEIINETMVGTGEFDGIRKQKFDEACARLIKEFQHEYCGGGNDMFSEPQPVWNTVVQRNCGNLSSDDLWLKKIMPEVEENEFSK